MRCIRILIIVEPGIDGAFRHADGLIRFLVQKGHHVNLAYSDLRSGPHLEKLLDFVTSHGGHVLNLKVSNSPSLADVKAFSKLWKFANKTQPDIIHSHSSKAGVLGRSLAFLGIRASYFYTPHAYYGLSAVPRRGTAFYNQIERAYGIIGTSIHVSHDENHFALKKLKLNPKKCKTITNPVCTNTFTPSSDDEKQNTRRRLGLPEKGIILGSMGRLSFQKDPQTLYRSFSLARSQGLDFYLFHVGQGELNTEIQLLANTLGIADRLIRKDYLSQPSEFYAAIDGLFLTSRYEGGWPLVILEALACNLPLICSNAPGISTLGSSSLTHCWTASVGDSVQFSDAIQKWYKDIQKPRSSNHRLIAESQFSIEACFGAVLKEYKFSVSSKENLTKEVRAHFTNKTGTK